MNKREIDKLMADLPSQQPRESLLLKVIVGIIFVLFLVFWLHVSDLERECFDQLNYRVSCELIAN